MALTISAKITSSSHSPFFPLWELKSEAQTLNPNSFLPTFFSGPSPCHKNAPFLIPPTTLPSPRLFLSFEIWTHFSISSRPGMNSYFVPASPHPHPPLSQARAAGHLPQHLCPPLGQSSEQGPCLSEAWHSARPWASANPLGKLLLPFQAHPHRPCSL